MDSLMSHTFLDTVQANPKVGTAVTGAALAASQSLLLMQNGHINPVIIELFQIGGYATTMLVGVFTVLGYVKKFRNKNDSSKDGKSNIENNN